MIPRCLDPRVREDDKYLWNEMITECTDPRVRGKTNRG